MHVQLRHICQPQTWNLKPEAIKILKLCVFLIVIFLLGLLHLDFNLVLRHEKNSLSSIPPTFPFTVCKPSPSARGMVLVALTAEYQECLKVALSMGIINASLHGCIVTRMRCVDTFCWHLSLIYLYRKDAWNVPVSLFFLNVVISLSLNDSAHNILKDVLTIMFICSCWKLALQWF